MTKVSDFHGVEDSPPRIPKAVPPKWPAAGVAEIGIGAGPAAVPGIPVALGRAAGGSAPAKVRVESIGADAAERLGGLGLGVRVARADGVATAARVRVRVDYSGFAGTLSREAASRLGLIEMPVCVLAARPDASCAKAAEKARVVPSRNEPAAQGVVAEIEAAGSPASGSVYVVAPAAAAGDPGSQTGNFTATDLKPAGTWQVGLSGGGFSYSYPIPLPPAVSGKTPELALSYSSSAIDSLTNYTNNQASVAGMGWDVGTGFVERRYRSCADDTVESTKNPDQRNWKHLCWESPDENDGDPATTDSTTSHLSLSVDGKSSAIVKDRTSGGWKAVEDYGWKIEYSTSSQTGQSFWTVNTADGTIYRFGYHRDSMWQTAYVGDDTGEPCRDQYSKTGTPGLCTAPWRWNLDQRIDAGGNVVDYTYAREGNWYCKVVGALCQPGPLGDGRAFRVAYDRGGYLAQVAYGRNVNVAGSAHVAKVVFNTVDRGTPPSSGAPWDDDTPKDLDCPSGPGDVIVACDTPGPAFYISKRLDTVVTVVFNPATSNWDQVWRLEAGYKWVYTQILQGLPPAGPVLWLDTLRPVGLAGDGPDVAMPPVDFEATLLDNRADYDEAQGKSRLRFPRIGSIYNGLGGRTDVSYGQANPCPYPSAYPTTGWDVNARDCYLATLGTWYDGGGISRTSRAVYLKWLVTQTVDKDLVGGSPDMPTRYAYLGTPAWARPFDYLGATTLSGVVCSPPVSGYCKTLSEDWDEFRGYQTVRTVKGSGTTPDDFAVTTTSFFRGMYDDVRGDGTAKGTQVTDFDGNSYQDRRVLAGRILQEQTWRATTLTASAAQAPRGARVITAARAPVRALARGLRSLFGRTTLTCSYPNWQRFASYSKGDRVTWVDHHWEALQGTAGSEPGKITNAWKDLGDCTAGRTTTPTPTPTDPGGPATGGYTEIRSTRYEYATASTGDGPGIYDPLRVNATRRVTREAVTSGFRYTDQRTSYDALGLPVKVNDYGDTSVASDNTCVTTTYARNTDSGMWITALRSVVETRKGDDCSAGAVVGRVVTLYDGQTDPATNKPVRGNTTEVRTWLDGSHVASEKTSPDGYGRPVSVTDVRGKTTSIRYLPAVGFPVDGTIRTNPLGYEQKVWNAPAHDGVVALRDANGRVTDIDYDALGRTTALWTPGQPKNGGTPATKITYNVSWNGSLGQPTAPPKVTTAKVFSGAGASAKWLTSVAFEDGLGRLREEQMPSPAGGRMVKVTAYDARGLEIVRSAPLHNTEPAGSNLLNPAPADIPSWTRTVFDGAGREIAKIQYGGATEVRRSTIAYAGADEHTVTPPLGGKTTYKADAAGKITSIAEQSGGQWSTSTREYDVSGDLTKMVDANGNVRTFTYDWARRRVAATDPDSGATTTVYDAAGNPTAETDARGVTVSHLYDDLGRRVEQWAGDPGTGTKLAEWVYDTLLKGQVTSATRWTRGRPYTDTVTGYDADYRRLGTSLTIPAGEGLLAGTYTFAVGYDKAGRENSLTFPAAGGLSSETTVSTSDDVGLPKGLSSDFGGGFTYVKDTGYSLTGRLSSRSLGSTAGLVRTLTWDPATNALTSLKTVSTIGATTPATVQEDQFSYDTAGSPISILDKAAPSGGSSTPQRECFGYDARRRLASAFTTTDTCAAGPNGAGPDPYELAYTYDAVGNIRSATQSGLTATYTYPAAGAGAVRPNAVRSITRTSGTDTYGYDARGQLESQTVGGTTSTFEWNELGRPAKVTIGANVSEEVYDAGGKRLIRREPGKTVLYLGVMELELANGQVTAKRYYQAPDGGIVAMRTSGRPDVTWLLAGPAGSEELAVDGGTGTLDRQKYLPFGARRGGRDALTTTDRGFLGKVEDDTTGLVELGERYYSPAIGKFISTDPRPVDDGAEPALLNPYSYAANDPLRLSDPTGLFPQASGGSVSCLPGEPLCPVVLEPPVDDVEERAALQRERQESSALLTELSTGGATQRASAGKTAGLKECQGLSDEICRIFVYVSAWAMNLTGSSYSKADGCPKKGRCWKNAMRHCIQQVALTDICGPKVAQQLAENHEKGNDMSKPKVRKDTKIDRHNNAVAQKAAMEHLDELRAIRLGPGTRDQKEGRYWAYVKNLCQSLWDSKELR
ncbi:hypothetical protein Ssi03_29160 [Sphaerisporangium siamense]|nr:hypothetical protein Ssi03_29160 [Sphaerisporangium siamense]